MTIVGDGVLGREGPAGQLSQPKYIPSWKPGPMPRQARVYITGHRGLVGSAVRRRFEAAGFEHVSGHDSSALDLRDPVATLAAFSEIRPEVLVLAAARVGGIVANTRAPVEFLEDNLQIQLSVLGAARRLAVPRVLFLGSSCVYPRLAPQPITEDALLTGPLEPTNDAYAIAKIAGIVQVRAMRQQFGFPWISAMPTNVYGPGDNFDLETAHALPAMLRGCHEAKHAAAGTWTVWGSGSPRREFLHVDDLADACLFLLEHYDGADPINVGTGVDLTIADLAALIARIVGFGGRIEFDPSRPDGTPRKLLDVSRLTGLGWQARTKLPAGIHHTYEWFREDRASA